MLYSRRVVEAEIAAVVHVCAGNGNARVLLARINHWCYSFLNACCKKVNRKIRAFLHDCTSSELTFVLSVCFV
jgi:hypothetical protein